MFCHSHYPSFFFPLLVSNSSLLCLTPLLFPLPQLDLSLMGCVRLNACVPTRLSALLHAFFYSAWCVDVSVGVCADIVGVCMCRQCMCLSDW